MKNSGLAIAAAILAALSGVLYWSNHRKAKESASVLGAEAAPKILSLPSAEVSKIQIKKKGADTLELAKDATGKWQITAPKALSADQDSVSSLVTTVTSLASDRLVDDRPSDVSQYGLTRPSLEVELRTKDNKTEKVLIGDETPTSSGSFAMHGGDPRVFTIATYTKTSLNKGVNDLRDKRLITADLDKASQLELIAKKQDIVFGRNKETWQIIKPKPLRADNSQVEDLLRQLREARIDLTAAPSADAGEKKIAAAFSAGTPIASVRVTDASGTQELQVRKNKDDYYAKSGAVAGIYKVSSDLGKAVDKGLEDFRNKRLFDFGFDEPSKIELRDGPKTYLLTKGGQDWWSDGKKMDASTVQSFIDKVRELTADKFLDSGFTTPGLQLIVTSNDGKRVEKVLLSKNGDKYIAKRENEPALYGLTGTSVAELQKAGADVKPAPVETKK